ncbi:hypothetical protein HELRODRAFT_182177 [Helobdella robusta]|uniref:Uncharacterized protein n=1 Tax=Helobdella robusta TaxID=6412 RepID=T1FHV7_HELRO|nr:hypothetical protein HELRODRAFT_182177 [Helobdella robusta]ESN91205.1 hypothetical protein HELRODRAFT_182177 [Helobdella robusta]
MGDIEWGRTGYSGGDRSCFSQKFFISDAKTISSGASLTRICSYHKLAGQDCVDFLLKKGQLEEDDIDDYDGTKSSKMTANVDYSNDDGYLAEALRDKRVRFGKRVVPKPRMG